ncbi:MAG: isoprenylcysteine carboxylmethyltransferase family protein, partial [Candidatus Micrarchaeota archaeon]|nr:isoprenylcysteine carboxylmethyltransferase family protein [Candidatus Micrarchaeota archaeon]
MDRAALGRKVILIFAAAVAAVALVLFLPAGTLDYWQAWAYMAVIYVPASAVIGYFLKNDPAFLARRFQLREKEKEQRLVQKLGGLVFLVGFFIPGLDQRFGW